MARRKRGPLYLPSVETLLVAARAAPSKQVMPRVILKSYAATIPALIMALRFHPAPSGRHSIEPTEPAMCARDSAEGQPDTFVGLGGRTQARPAHRAGRSDQAAAQLVENGLHPV